MECKLKIVCAVGQQAKCLATPPHLKKLQLFWNGP